MFILDAIDFHAPVKLGHILHLTGRATFTSSRSMEIEVVVDAKDYVAGMNFVLQVLSVLSKFQMSDLGLYSFKWLFKGVMFLFKRIFSLKKVRFRLTT